MDHGRARRADSARNRVRILAAARELVDRSGDDVVMSEIAARAGVAVGTLYNHFPTKADLVAAIVSDYVREVAERAVAVRAEVDSGKPAGESLRGFLAYVLEATAATRAAKRLVAGTSEVDGDNERRAVTELESVVHAARAEGSVRSDLTVQDLYLLIGSAPLDAAPEQRARWLELVVGGVAG